MTISDVLSKSTNNLKVIVEIVLGQINTQWINIGAGIWMVNFANVYPFVDAALLSGFTAQTFGYIGSVWIDGIQCRQASGISDLSTESSYYFDEANQQVYVVAPDFSDPRLFYLTLGVTFPVSFNEFTPQNSKLAVQGRLLTAPSVSKQRDSLFFGKLTFDSSSVSVSNADGFFDHLMDSYNIYGDLVKVRIGADGIDYANYALLNTWYIRSAKISETEFTLSVGDPREILTREMTFEYTGNALEAIRQLLWNAYETPYTSQFYNTTEWAAAEALAPLVFIDYWDPDNTKTVISIIEEICTSAFGVFDSTSDGKYTFRYLSGVTSTVSIPSCDILSAIELEYSSDEVVTSVKIGWNRDWEDNAYTDYYIDTSQEELAFAKYRVYNQQSFETLLISDPPGDPSVDFATNLLNKFKDVHAKGSVTIPLKYYTLSVGDNISISLDRPNQTMFGTVTAEVLGFSYDLDNGLMELQIRI